MNRQKTGVVDPRTTTKRAAAPSAVGPRTGPVRSAATSPAAPAKPVSSRPSDPRKGVAKAAVAIQAAPIKPVFPRPVTPANVAMRRPAAIPAAPKKPLAPSGVAQAKPMQETRRQAPESPRPDVAVAPAEKARIRVNGRSPGRTNTGIAARMNEIRDVSVAALEGMHAAREFGIQSSRKVIQLSSQAIRAAHRGEFDTARELVHDAGILLVRVSDKISSQPLIRYSGFMHDGEKEYSEAAITTAFISGSRVPDMYDLGVSASAYLNGLAEAASELRRTALDAMRRADPGRADVLLTHMDEAMGVVEAIDFPEAVTGGLRRTTDALRSVVERTRGDVTAALRQQSLEIRLKAIEGR